MTSKNPNPFADSSDTSPARQKLVACRNVLLKLHKSLLEMERREYQREHGFVSVGELFRLVIDHEQFAWLHNISEFVVRIDESLAGENPVTAEEKHNAIILAP